jgi:hypothetical protein
MPDAAFGRRADCQDSRLEIANMARARNVPTAIANTNVFRNAARKRSGLGSERQAGAQCRSKCPMELGCGISS